MNQELIRELVEALEGFPIMAMATIVQTWGSTPRKAGAKMLIYPDGRISGTIGGGCSEAEVIKQARMVLDSATPQLYSVSMTGDVAADEGMVCGGRMDVYIEPICRD